MNLNTTKLEELLATLKKKEEEKTKSYTITNHNNKEKGQKNKKTNKVQKGVPDWYQEYILKQNKNKTTQHTE